MLIQGKMNFKDICVPTNDYNFAVFRLQQNKKPGISQKTLDKTVFL